METLVTVQGYDFELAAGTDGCGEIQLGPVDLHGHGSPGQAWPDGSGHRGTGDSLIVGKHLLVG
jgi:hypothetical protein